MSKRKSTEQGATPDQSVTDDQESTVDGAKRPVVRWRLVLWALGLLGVAGGYYGSQFARAMVRSSVIEPAATAESTPVLGSPEKTQNPPLLTSPPVTLDPDWPLPETAQALTDEAVAVIDKLIEGFPDSVDMLEMKARTQVWLGDSAQAVQTWQECLRRDPKYVHAYVGMASAAAARAEHEEAARLAREALALQPASFQARETLADSLLQLGRAPEVPEVLEEYLAQDPRSRCFYLLGQAYLQLKEYGKAKAQYEAAVRIYPDYTEAYNGLAVACDRLGEKEQAEQARAKFRELGSPENAAQRIRGAKESDLVLMCRDAAVLYTDAGRVCYVGDRQADAETLWLRAAALDGKDVGCRQSLAWLCRNANRPGETIVWLHQLSALEPANPSYAIEIGRIYESLQNLPAAEEAFRKACQMAPLSDEGYAALVDLLLRYDKNLDETRALAEKAVQLRPTASNYAVLAVACRENHDLPAARAAIDQAVELMPHHAAYRAIRDSIVAQQKQ